MGRSVLRPYRWNCVQRGENSIDFGAQWGARADWVGGRGVAGEKQGLTAATAKILLAAVAVLARFLHPIFAAELLKRI